MAVGAERGRVHFPWGRAVRVRVNRTTALLGLCCLLVGLAVGAVGMYAVTRPSGNPAKPVAEAWINALQAKDLNKMSALFTADAVWEDGATGDLFTGGADAEVAGWQDPLGSMRVKQARILGIGDRVAIVAWTIFGPTPGHSSPINLPGISVLHVKDGQITRETVFYNTTAAYGD